MHYPHKCMNKHTQMCLLDFHNNIQNLLFLLPFFSLGRVLSLSLSISSSLSAHIYPDLMLSPPISSSLSLTLSIPLTPFFTRFAVPLALYT